MKSLQAKTMIGKDRKWADIEADEVDLGKEGDQPSGKAKWEQWGGMVERGQPHTLVLYRLTPKLTTKRAPGHVVHKKKRVKINGKFTWVKPHYT